MPSVSSFHSHQKITVEHMSVNDGGQAILGVTTNGMPEKKGDKGDKDE
jgi:hypothetical protein